MDAASEKLLNRAEQLLREGNKQTALPILAGYLKQYPNSPHAWWLLSQAVGDRKQQIECLERVLKLAPMDIPARTRLEIIKGGSSSSQSSPLEFPARRPQEPIRASNPPSQPAQVPAFLDTDSLDSPVERPVSMPGKTPQPKSTTLTDLISSKNATEVAGKYSKPVQPPAAPEKPVADKKKNQKVLQYSVLAAMLCVLIGVFGFITVLVVRGAGLPAQAAPASSITQISLPPTWTPTVTSTALPSMTPFVTSTSTPAPTSDPSQMITDISNAEVGPYIGYLAPAFSLKEVNENKQVRLSDYAGQVVLIQFWATWCNYCEAQMSALQMVYNIYNKQGLVVLAVDVGEPEALARDFSKAHSLTFPILGDTSSNVSSEYQVTGFPTLFFIEKSGLISYVNVGMTDYWKINGKVQEMLGLTQ